MYVTSLSVGMIFYSECDEELYIIYAVISPGISLLSRHNIQTGKIKRKESC
jgi:hypothetical protein